MEVPNFIDFKQFREKMKDLRGTLESRTHLLDTIKILEEEKNRFEKLYIDQVKSSTEIAKQFITSTTCQEKYIDLQKKYETLQREKVALKQQHEDLITVKDCQYHLKVSELKEEMDQLTQKHKNELNKTERHFKGLLNQTNNKIKQLIISNGQLQGEIQLLMTMQSQNEFINPQSSTSKEDIKYYQERLRNAESCITELLMEKQQKNEERGFIPLPNSSSRNNPGPEISAYNNSAPNMKSLASSGSDIIDIDLTDKPPEIPILQSSSEFGVTSEKPINKERKIIKFTVDAILHSQMLQKLDLSKPQFVAKSDTNPQENNLDMHQPSFHQEILMPCTSTSARTSTRRETPQNTFPSLTTSYMNVMNTSNSANESLEMDSNNQGQSHLHQISPNQMWYNANGLRKRRYSFTRKLPNRAKKRKLLNDSLLNVLTDPTDTSD